MPGSAGGDHPPRLRSIAEGFGYLRGRQVLQGAYLIDINTTVFGMPKAVFPALAATVFGGAASTLGFLYAAPGAGGSPWQAGPMSCQPSSATRSSSSPRPMTCAAA